MKGRPHRIEEVFKTLGEKALYGVFSPYWEESMRSLPSPAPFFLQPGNLDYYCRFCGLEPAARGRVTETARRILASPGLLRLAWHCHRLLFFHDDYDSFTLWPEFRRVLGDDAGVFNLVTALSMTPGVITAHESLGIPGRITRDTCLQVKCFCSNYEFARGRPGIFNTQLGWLRNYPAGRLFRLGRFEYMLKPFNLGITVFRNRQTGRVACLLREGAGVDEEGYVLPKGGGSADSASWVSSYDDRGDFFRGFPAGPEGRVSRKPVALPKEEWGKALAHGDDTLDMHIPAGGGMTIDKCGESFRKAAAFFREFFPGRPFSAITSSSWIFFGGIPGILGPDSNIARFQEELFLFPVPSTGKSGLWFIFFEEDVLSRKPELKTSLQKALYEHLVKGGKVRSGGMFFMAEHLAKFGKRFYRGKPADLSAY